MRDLYANQTAIWCCTRLKSEPAVDENGDYTGEPIRTYSQPVELRVCLSPSRGTVADDAFGQNVSYTRTISTCRQLRINEQSLIWLTDPGKEPDPTTADYTVVAVARGLHHIKYALRERVKNAN